MSQRSLRRRALTWLVALCAAYLALAYFAASEFWTFHDRDFRTQRFEMVTHTPQGIPGDPINVGLVGTLKELVPRLRHGGMGYGRRRHPENRDRTKRRKRALLLNQPGRSSAA